ncbi:Protein of uncharacterised function (DUF551) [Raoultella planticola]|uniref:DUF551 domain-containing protein n=1 Tax=Raoultella planticola TaxID=575 RepID=UPI0010D35533|nr:DUF551 domain-containing protein [Raoultella planticola]VTN00427.1 Protein of uncharacterised function (DUF551) [Raoultella planticola]
MTSKLTRERLEQLADNNTICKVSWDERIELAQIALAAMDSEPAAENIRIADALEGLLWPNMAIGNKAVIQAAIEALRAYHAQPAPVVQCPFPCGWDNLNKLAIQDAAFVARGLVEGEPTTEAHRQAAISNNDRLLKVISACRAAMLAAAQQPQDEPQNIPEIIPGWIPVSERMPDDDDFVYIWPRPDFGVELHVGQYCECSPKGDGWYAQVYEQNYGIEWYPITVTHWMPLPADPQEVNHG